MACIGVLLLSADCGNWWLYRATPRQGGLHHVLAAVEPVGLEHVCEMRPLTLVWGALGLVSRCSMPNSRTQPIKLMLATGLVLLAGQQAIGKLLAIVGQHLGDLDRAGLVQCLQEGLGTGCSLGWS